MELFNFFSGFAGGAGYLIVLGTLLLCGLGAPVPEDIILISGGYIAFEAGHSVWPMVFTGLVGILAGDSIMFGMGRRLGVHITNARFLKRLLTPERLEKVNGLFQKHGHKIILAARFMPGVRSVTFFSAGAMGVPYWRFFVLDGLAALISAPLWVILGYRLGHTVVEKARSYQWVILAGVAVIFGISWVVKNLWSRRKAAKAPAASLPTTTSVPRVGPKVPETVE